MLKDQVNDHTWGGVDFGGGPSGSDLPERKDGIRKSRNEVGFLVGLGGGILADFFLITGLELPAKIDVRASSFLSGALPSG